MKTETIHKSNDTLVDISIFASANSIIFHFPKYEITEHHILDLASIADSLILHDKLYFLGVPDAAYNVTMDEVIQELGEFSEKIKFNFIEIDHEKDKKENIIPNPKVLQEKYLTRDFISVLKKFKYLSKAPLKGDFIQYLKDFGIIDPQTVMAFAQAYRIELHMYYMPTLKIPYFPHGVRLPIIHKRITLGRYAIKKMEEYKKQKLKKLDPIPHKFDIDLPLLLGVILKDCNSPSDILDEIINFRNSTSAQRFRKYCGEFKSAIAGEDIVKAVKYKNKLDHYIASLEHTRTNKISFDWMNDISLSDIIELFELHKLALKVASKFLNKLSNRVKYRDLILLDDLSKKADSISSFTGEFNRVFKNRINPKTFHKLKSLCQVDKNNKYT